jgi:putative ABC transport system permease protein
VTENVSVIALDWVDLAIAAGLVVVAGVISLLMKLNIERRLAIAAARSIAQLLLVGYVLRWVFGLKSLYALLPVFAFMIFTASHTAIKRPSRAFPGISLGAATTLIASGLVTTVTATRFIVGVVPWYEPQYIIPLLGMALGNTMNAISLCTDHLLETLSERKSEVEMELAMGASRWEAARGPMAEAVRRAMIPIINTMMVVGIVSLPGMMTGQILAGADPVVAVKYQIMIIFMIAAGTSLGSMMMAVFTYGRLFSNKHQLLADRIRRRR